MLQPKTAMHATYQLHESEGLLEVDVGFGNLSEHREHLLELVHGGVVRQVAHKQAAFVCELLGLLVLVNRQVVGRTSDLLQLVVEPVLAEQSERETEASQHGDKVSASNLPINMTHFPHLDLHFFL